MYLPNDYISLTWDIDSESQIDDFYVGIGLDPSEAESPQLIAYASTNRKTHFKHQHEGVSSDEIFYIFVKAVSKTGLEDIIIIGPMIVDSTPPIIFKKPNVHIISDNVMVSWEEMTFYDPEQDEQINRIEYTFGHNEKVISNRLIWHLTTNQSCGNDDCCCITYPLEHLQKKDSNLRVNFYATLLVYNNAGHFTEVKTEVFYVPSLNPPDHVVVHDVDPNLKHLNDDIDVHFSSGTLCAFWTEYKLQENVNIEIGIGSSYIVADIEPFRLISDTTMPCCIHSSKLQVDGQFHFLVKAVGSGGSVVSASDGVYVLDTVENIQSNIKVYSGIDCSAVAEIDEIQIANLSESSYHLRFDKKFEKGGVFTLFITADNEPLSLVTFISEDAIILSELTGKGKVTFTSLIERPRFKLKLEEEPTYKDVVTFKVVRCPSPYVLSNENRIASHWITGLDSNISSVWYEAGIVRNGSENLLISEYEYESSKMHVFKNANLFPSIDYRFAVKVCTKQTCLPAIYSDVFIIEKEKPAGNIETVELSKRVNKTCFDIKMIWSSFMTDREILFYEWSISKDMTASHIVTKWKTVKIFDKNKVHVEECLHMQPYAYAHLFGCVKAYSVTGSQSMTCKTIVVKQREAYVSDKYEVYDLNSSSDSWNFVLSVVHSERLSDAARSMLHNIDIDIAPSEWTVAGAVMGTYGRSISWYLMTSKYVPTSCFESAECHYTTNTDTGFVEFPRNIVLLNKLFYICAFSNATILRLEDVPVPLDELSSCSNGFFKDDIPPFAQKNAVRVSSQNGYITDMSRVIISWDEFTDNMNASVFGYPGNIRAYSYAVGSSIGNDDITRFTDVGHSTVVVTRNMNISDGFPVYVTVKAFDYVDLEAVVYSSELIVDSSPPIHGRIFIEPEMSEINAVSFIDRSYLFLHLTEFKDGESGLSHFEIGVGTHRFLNNIMPLTKYNMDATVRLKLDDGIIIDGRVYFINVKAINNAGLSSAFINEEIKIDRSPPTGGHVIEGDSLEQVDEDFINEVHHFEAHWKGFVDTHSGIHYYRCGLGTEPYIDDVHGFINVGLKEHMTWKGPLFPGQRYYTTVEACNHAGQCSSVSSDGVILDDSAPVAGVVRIGSLDLHQKYYPHPNWIHIHWAGFVDPQSGIDHYEVCVGTSVGECDSIQMFNNQHYTNTIKTEVNLPLNTNLYATVIAFNRIGMNISRTSDSFKIDNSLPDVEQTPRFINPLTNEAEPFVQWEKSILKIEWLFSDHESPIINHDVTLYTHHEGHTPVEHVSLGSQNNFTINLEHREWLHNGDIYFVKVTACNAAGLCTTEKSADLLIDATPPHVGGFKQPLKWSTYDDTVNEPKTNLTLTWYGFHDQESFIENFFITVSKSYSGHELAGGIVSMKIKNSTNEYTSVIPLVKKISRDELLVLSIWAENQAGLTSPVARVSVYVLSETSNDGEGLKYGSLEIEKHSCDIHFCNKDCTCAVFGQPCTYYESNSTCNEIDSSLLHSLGLPTVDVRFGYIFEKQQTITSSSSCLSGTWKSENNENNEIERYEWSIGLSGQPVGESIFDLKTRQPWNDVGKQEDVTYCLPVNRSLIHSESYLFYIRAWYSHDKYATYMSDPIIIDQSAPSVRRGKFVKDSDGSCNLDYDFINWTQNITACWFGVFGEYQGSIIHYTVAFGTLPRADDIFPNTDVGLASYFTLRNISLTHGTKYYCTVTAHNTAGLSTSLASDGFLVDTDDPIEGIVYNTINWQNREFQSTDSSIGISWSGFADHFSGINHYLVALSETEDDDALENIVFQPVFLKTYHTFNNMNLEQNKTYYGVVKAADAAGHFSKVAISPGIVIDSTKPTGFKCKLFGHILSNSFLFNGSSESTAKSSVNTAKGDLIRVAMTVESADIHSKVYIGVGTEKTYLNGLRLHDGIFEFLYTFFAQESPETMVSFSVWSTEDSQLNIIIDQCLSFEIDDKNTVTVSQIGFSVLRINTYISDKESNICSLQLGAGTTSGGFQVQQLKTFHHNSNHAIIRASVGHGSPIYVTAIVENCAGGTRAIFKADPIIMDKTGPFIDDVHTSVEIVSHATANATMEQYVSVEASWKVKDYESGIKYCLCAIETRLGAQDIKPFWNADSKTSCFSGNLKFSNGSTVIVAIRCVNTVELATHYSTNPQTIAIHPHHTEHGNGYILPSDNDNVAFRSNLNTFIQTNKYSIKMGWSALENAGDISYYEYRLSRNGAPLIPWLNVAARDVVVLNGLKLDVRSCYTVEVKATNKYGLTSDTVSANVTVLEEKPRISGNPLSISKDENQITLDWSRVFTTYEGIPVSYSLAVGTKKGYADILDIGYITTSKKTLTVPRTTILTPNPKNLYIRIGCTYPFGLDEVYEKTYTI